MTEGHENGLNRTLGRLESKIESAEKSREKIYEKLDDLVKISGATNTALALLQENQLFMRKQQDNVILPAIADYKKNKSLGVGLLAGVGVAGGSIGAALTKYLPFWVK
jgi:hypothetical protein